MKGILLLFWILASTFSFSQKRILCEGLKSISGGIVVINGKTTQNCIRKPDLLKYDFEIKLSDTSYKIQGFVASYDCHSKSVLFDINSRTYFTNRIKGNDAFIRHIWTGDILSIDCINIKKNGKTSVVPGLSFKIVN